LSASISSRALVESPGRAWVWAATMTSSPMGPGVVQRVNSLKVCRKARRRSIADPRAQV
jgi:hypothetical protein